MLPSKVQAQSGRSCQQTITDKVFNHRWNFGLNEFPWNDDNLDYFTQTKEGYSQFFADSEKYVSNATVHS